jgi:hypothetical protein
MIRVHRNDELIRALRPEFLNSGGGGGPTITVSEGPGIDIVVVATNNQIGLGGDTILLYKANGNPVAEYAATDAGLTAALAATVAGDIVIIPACTIAGDHTIPTGVRVVGLARFGSILTGQVTGGSGASLENCSITRTANDANVLYGVVAQAAGTFYLSRVHVSVTQAGVGNAAAIYSNAGGDVEAWNCSLLAPVGGVGWHYGVYLDVGGNLVYVEAGVCVGFTGATNWSP